jgi:hypothetical protein
MISIETITIVTLSSTVTEYKSVNESVKSLVQDFPKFLYVNLQ